MIALKNDPVIGTERMSVDSTLTVSDSSTLCTDESSVATEPCVFGRNDKDAKDNENGVVVVRSLFAGTLSEASVGSVSF